MDGSRWRLLGGLAPATLLIIIMMVLPLLALFSFGFFEIDRGVFTGKASVRAYSEVVSDPFYRSVFLRTLNISALVTLLCLMLGYPIAYVFTLVSGKWRILLLLFVLAPLLTSTLVRTFGWMVILGNDGIVNMVLRRLRIVDHPISFLFNFRGVLIGMAQVLLPFMVLPLIGSLHTVPSQIREAAINLGASQWQVFWKVIVPQTTSGIATGVTLVFILAFSDFPVPMLMGGATFAVLPVYIYQTMTNLLDWSRGAALASFLLVGSAVITYLLQMLFRRAAPWMGKDR